MNRETSIYLDLVRFTASMIVFIGHISGQRLTGGFLWQVGPFMDDAVIVFFVLSGFVIAHVCASREVTPAQYAIARAARVYSVALPALFLTFTLDCLGKIVAPEIYSSTWGYVENGQIQQFIMGLFFLNELWYYKITIGSMLPYWSLGFEVWYYIIFGLIFFYRGKWKVFFVLTAFLIVGPRVASLFPIWLLGYFSYKQCALGKLNRYVSLLMFLGSIIGFVLHFYFKDKIFAVDFISAIIGEHSILSRYTVGILFALNLIGFAGISSMLQKLMFHVEKPIRWLAGATFTIYLFHLPVAQFLSALLPWPVNAWATRLVIVGGTLILMFMIAELTERRKTVWAVALTHCYNRVSTFRLCR